MLILYRIKKKVLPFHFLKENFTKFLEKPFLILSFVARHGAFQIPIYVLLLYMIKSGVFPTSVAYSPVAYKKTV